jgi:hypothetical protein
LTDKKTSGILCELSPREHLSSDKILENDTEKKNAEPSSYPARWFKERQSIRK